MAAPRPHRVTPTPSRCASSPRRLLECRQKLGCKVANSFASGDRESDFEGETRTCVPSLRITEDHCIVFNEKTSDHVKRLLYNCLFFVFSFLLKYVSSDPKTECMRLITRLTI